MMPIHQPPTQPGRRLARCGFGLTGLGLSALVLSLALLSNGAIRSALAAAICISLAIALVIAGFLTMVVAADPFAEEEGVPKRE